MRAEAAARQLGRLTLDNALKLLFLYAEKEPIKFERAALRWLGRYVTEGKATSLLKAQLALAALSELRAGERESAAPARPRARRGRGPAPATPLPQQGGPRRTPRRLSPHDQDLEVNRWIERHA
jgi:hypothetical protein